jgi:hypothetical protein
MCLFTLYINIKLQGLIFCFYSHSDWSVPFFCLSEYPFKRIQINVSYTGFNKLTCVALCTERILGGGHNFPEHEPSPQKFLHRPHGWCSG